MAKVNNVVRTLRLARKLITAPGTWIRNRLNMELADGGHAYCALGAVGKAKLMLGEEGYAVSCDPAVIALDAAIPKEEKGAIYQWPNGCTTDLNTRVSRVATYNNRHDQKTVLEWFDKAIAIQQEHPMERL